MSARYLLDTNIVIFALRNRGGELIGRLSAQDGRLAVSTITVSELMFGVEKAASPKSNRRAVDEVLAMLEVQEFDTDAAIHAGEIRADLGRRGTPIGSYDVLIAAHARSRGLVAVTNNVREFARVPGLIVEDWTKPTPPQ